MDIAQITSLLSAAAVPSNAVTALADVVLEGEKIFAPLIADHLLHANDNEAARSIENLVATLNAPDSADRASALHDQLYGLVRDNGNPVAGGVPGEPLIGVRVSLLLALAVDAIKYRRDEKVIANVVATATKPKS